MKTYFLKSAIFTLTFCVGLLGVILFVKAWGTGPNDLVADVNDKVTRAKRNQLVNKTNGTKLDGTWPAIINCRYLDSGSNRRNRLYYYGAHNMPSAEVYYFTQDSGGTNQIIKFNDTGTRKSKTTSGTLQCTGKTIATIISEGNAFNFFPN